MAPFAMYLLNTISWWPDSIGSNFHRYVRGIRIFKIEIQGSNLLFTFLSFR
jgi:hypothetical protein